MTTPTSTDRSAAVQPPAGWYRDPSGGGDQRWWDGLAWTEFRRGVTAAPQPEPALAGNAGLGAPASDESPARDSLYGGGIAIVGWVGSLVLSAALAGLAIATGSPAGSVSTTLIGLIGLWSGLLLTSRVIATRNGNPNFASLGFRALTAKDVGIGIVVGLVARFVATRVAMLLWDVLPHDTLDRRVVITGPSASTVGLLVLALCICLGAPIVEEIYFRGVVQSILMRGRTAAAAITVQAILFGLVHYQLGMGSTQAIITIASIATAGAAFGWVRWRYGTLGPAIVAHSVFNLTAVLLMMSQPF